MDAREKWMTQLAELCFAFYDTYQSGLSERAAALDAIQAHARTTPEGFALVPAPEWVPVGERLPVVPEGESMINVWYAYKDFVGACPISRDGAWSLPSHATHWQHNYEPAPPKSEPL